MILLKNSNVKNNKNRNLQRRLDKLELENNTLKENLDQFKQRNNELEALNLKNCKENNQKEESKEIVKSIIKQHEDRCTELAEENQRLKQDNEQLFHKIGEYKHMINEVDSHEELQSRVLK